MGMLRIWLVLGDAVPLVTVGVSDSEVETVDGARLAWESFVCEVRLRCMASTPLSSVELPTLSEDLR